MTRGSRKHEAAARWFLRLHRHECSAAEREEFRVWRSDPQNAAAYAAIEAAWAWSGESETPALEALRDEARKLERGRPRWPAAVAALAAAVLVTAGLFLRPPAGDGEGDARVAGGHSTETYVPGNVVYSTAVGERSTVTFGDGSVVFLNTSTRLRADYSSETRAIELLDGQALFEVAHDPERPFIVVAGERRVIALGTAFDVRIEENRLQVTLIEGRVSIEARNDASGAAYGGRTELEAGQQLIDSAVSGLEVREAPVGRVTSWREGRLIFEDEPLADAVSEMNRYSTTRIRLGDPELGRLRVSGVFRTGQSRVFVEALVAYFPIEVTPPSPRGEIVLTRR